MPLTHSVTTRKVCQGPPQQGYAETRKKKSYVAVLKFNKHHDPEDGRFTFASGGSGKTAPEKTERKATTGHHPDLTPAQRAMQEELEKQDKKPVHKVNSAEEAVALVLKGEKVEIRDIRDVHTVLKKLGEMALDAKSKGTKAPNYDLCNVTVKGANMFCTEKIRTEKFPHGIPRIEMPQFKSKHPTPGSEADKLPRKDGEVDASQAFLEHLKEAGVSSKEGKILARKLKASQAEMEGAKVSGMMLDEGRDPKKAKIWVSKDGYVIDGHHTWAAAVGRDAADGNLDNDMEMDVHVVDMTMSEVYHLAVPWSQRFGLPAAGVKKRAS